jgi:LacI family transcriptional regulator
MPATIKDIARRVGKSTTTVSRALNDYGDVSSETKLLVRAVAEELGYLPNTAAQRLQKRSSDTIGLIIPTTGPRFSDPFFSEFIAGIGNTAARVGYDLLVATRAPGSAEMETYIATVRAHRVDGLIVVRTRRKDLRIEWLRASRFPFVSFGRVEPDDGELDFPYVDEDGEYGMRLVVEHLAALGHRRLACIAPPEELNFTRHRLAGVRSAWAALGLAPADLRIATGDLTQRGGYEQAAALLDGANPPTAIAACNDLMALGAMRAALERGLTVGRDVSVTGFDNIPLAEYSHPPLTTVNQPIYRIACILCEMLVRRLHNADAPPEQTVLTPELVVRQSTGPAPAA